MATVHPRSKMSLGSPTYTKVGDIELGEIIPRNGADLSPGKAFLDMLGLPFLYLMHWKIETSILAEFLTTAKPAKEIHSLHNDHISGLVSGQPVRITANDVCDAFGLADLDEDGCQQRYSKEDLWNVYSNSRIGRFKLKANFPHSEEVLRLLNCCWFGRGSDRSTVISAFANAVVKGFNGLRREWGTVFVQQFRYSTRYSQAQVLSTVLRYVLDRRTGNAHYSIACNQEPIKNQHQKDGQAKVLRGEKVRGEQAAGEKTCQKRKRGRVVLSESTDSSSRGAQTSIKAAAQRQQRKTVEPIAIKSPRLDDHPAASARPSATFWLDALVHGSDPSSVMDDEVREILRLPVFRKARLVTQAASSVEDIQFKTDTVAVLSSLFEDLSASNRKSSALEKSLMQIKLQQVELENKLERDVAAHRKSMEMRKLREEELEAEVARHKEQARRLEQERTEACKRIAELEAAKGRAEAEEAQDEQVSQFLQRYTFFEKDVAAMRELASVMTKPKTGNISV